MKRAVKRNTLIALLVCMLVSFGALCAMFGLNAKNAVFADTASEYTKPATFEMFDGAQVRKTEDTSGIRFITVVSNDYIAELKTAHGADNVKFGAVVLPEDMLGENELTVELEHANKIPSGGFAEENAEAGYSVYNSAIINIPETMYGKAIAARGYVAITGEDGAVTYTYTATTVKRSIGYVASMAHYVGNDTSSVVKGYVDAVAKGVTVGGKTEDTLKVALTQITNAEGEPLSYAIVTDPAGYAYKATSTNEQVVKVENGAVVPVAKAGTATVTVEFGTKTATLNLTVANYKIIVDGNDVNEGDEFNVFSADEYLGVSKDETKTHTYAVQEDVGEGFKPVTATVTGNENGVVDLTEDGVVKGGTSVGKANLTFNVGDITVGTVTVNGCAKITEIAHMDKLALVTWDYKNDVETAKKYLAATYVLGNDLDYAGQRILPIANVAPKIGYSYVRHDSSDKLSNWWTGSDLGDYLSFNSVIWRDILTAYDNRGDADWRTVKAAKIADGTWATLKTVWEDANNFNKAGLSTEINFAGSNPNYLPFTGVFDGNGYSIKRAQTISANFLEVKIQTQEQFRFSGWCVFGENHGTITNIDFDDLRCIEIYGEEDGFTGVGNITTGECANIYRYNGKSATYCYNGVSTLVGGFVRYNADSGIVSNIKISFVATDDYTYGYWNDKTKSNQASAYGVTNNRGLVENMVLVSVYKSDYYGSQLTGQTGAPGSGVQNMFYATNLETGIFKNCLVLSEVKENTKKILIHNGTDNETSYNQNRVPATNQDQLGTMDNCTIFVADDSQSAVEKLVASDYDKLSFTSAWDITETAMTLKRGGLFN